MKIKHLVIHAVVDPKINDELGGDGVDDIPAYEAKGVLTTPHGIGLYQEDFKDENDAVNVKYVETQVSNLNKSLAILNDLYNIVNNKIEKKTKYYCGECKL